MKRFSVIATVLALVLGLSTAASASPSQMTSSGVGISNAVQYVLTPRPAESPDVTLFRVGSHHMMGGGCDTFMLTMAMVL